MSQQPSTPAFIPLTALQRKLVQQIVGNNLDEAVETYLQMGPAEKERAAKGLIMAAVNDQIETVGSLTAHLLSFNH